MTRHAQNNLFGNAQIAQTDLRAFAQNFVRKKTNPLPQGDLRKARAKPREGNARFSARANPLGLFGASDDALEELKLEARQLVAAITEMNGEATALNVELAPWYEAARDAAKWHNKDMEKHWFRLGGEQAATRRQWVETLDRLRSGLAPVFRLAGEVRNAIRSAENRLRIVRADIKIIEGKMKRKRAA